MKLTKLWVILGILSLIVALVLFCIETFIARDYWNWKWLRFESGVSIAACVGIAILVIAGVEHWLKR